MSIYNNPEFDKWTKYLYHTFKVIFDFKPVWNCVIIHSNI